MTSEEIIFAHYVMHRRVDAMWLLLDVPRNRVCEMEGMCACKLRSVRRVAQNKAHLVVADRVDTYGQNKMLNHIGV
jgi:hypothetical protein